MNFNYPNTLQDIKECLDTRLDSCQDAGIKRAGQCLWDKNLENLSIEKIQQDFNNQF